VIKNNRNNNDDNYILTVCGCFNVENKVNYILDFPGGTLYVVPKGTIKFYGEGALKMYRLVAHLSLYAHVTLKSGRWGMPSLHPKGLREENSHEDKNINSDVVNKTTH
jgi:hypothetical protein